MILFKYQTSATLNGENNMNEITSTSTSTDVLATLDAQGIVNINQPTYFDDNAKTNHEIAAFLVNQSMLKAEGDKGYIFITAADLIEWEDSRMLKLSVGAIGETSRSTIMTPIIEAVQAANFTIQELELETGSMNFTLTIHVPKSRF
jgi:hypothetical protein